MYYQNTEKGHRSVFTGPCLFYSVLFDSYDLSCVYSLFLLQLIERVFEKHGYSEKNKCTGQKFRVMPLC